MEQINGKVKVSGAYFLKMAKADYRNYREALWREIYQNSIDAGATEINVVFDKEARSMTITDNGCGMSLETLVEKLLALGGTHKAEGSTGAFGKAKELELFAHERYVLSTHNLLLMGSGDDYTITETEDYFDGTSITLYIQQEEDFGSLCSYAEGVAKKIETNTTIYVEGNPIPCQYPKGEFRKALDVGDIYVNENLPSSSYARVRMNGIWMFDQYIGSEMPHVTVELSGNSIASMTSNRDGLKDRSLQSANDFFQKLASDRKSSLFPDKEEMILRARGTDGTQITISDEDMGYLEKFMDADREDFVTLLSKYFTVKCLDIDEALTKMRADGVDIYDYQRLKYFGFRWDTIHKFEKGKEKEAKNFLDGSAVNAKRAKTLLTMWGETLKQVLLDIESYTKFTVGYNWDEKEEAQLSKANDCVTFFLNPSILETYPLTNKRGLARKLKLLAVHEVAHLRSEYHDEYWMMAFHAGEEKTWKSDKCYERIAKIKG